MHYTLIGIITTTREMEGNRKRHKNFMYEVFKSSALAVK
jgi:hypothetical protein